MSELSFSIELETRKLQEQIREVNSKLDQIGQQAQSAATASARSFDQVGGSLKRLSALAGNVFGGIALGGLAQQVIKVRTEIDSLERSFVTLTRSAETGAELTEWIKEFAAATPLSVQGLAQATQTMLSFGISAEETRRYITALGDISRGNEQRLNSLALAFSQMSATGKLMGQDLLQMINAGFNPLTVIAEKTGQTMAELKERMGEVPIEEVKQAFIDATEEGGLFYGMLAKQSEGLAGLQGQLKGTITDTLNRLGEETEGIIKGGLTLANEAMQTIQQLTPLIVDATIAFGSYKTALLLVTAVEEAAAKVKGLLAIRNTALARTQIALNNAIKANPYAIATAAVVALGLAIYKLVKSQGEAETATDRANAELERQTQLVDERRKKGEDAIRVLKDETATTQQQVAAYEELQALSPSVFGNIDLQTAKLKAQTGAQRELNQALEQYALEQKRAHVEQLKQQEQELTWNIRNDPQYFRQGGQLKQLREQIAIEERDLAKTEAEVRHTEEKAAESRKTVAEQLADYDEQIRAKRTELAELRKGTAEANIDAIKQTEKELKALQESRELLTGDTGRKKSETKRPDPTEALKKEINARREYEDLLSETIAADLALLEEGNEKEERLLEEQHRLRIQAIRREREDLATERKGQGRSLTAEEEEAFAKQLQAENTALLVAIDERREAEEQAHRDLLDGYLSYLQQREQIETEAQAKAAAIRQSAAALGEDPTPYLDTLTAQTEEALRQLDQATASKQAGFRRWLAALADLSIDQLRRALTQAKSDLAELQQSGKATGDALAVAFSKVDALEEALAEAQAKSDASAKDTAVSWTDLAEVIDRAAQSFGELGDRIGGTAGEIVSALGAAATGTVQIINSIQAAAKASAGAVSMVERASVILTVISTVLQVAQRVAALFDTDKLHDERIEALQQEIDSLQWELEYSEQLRHLRFTDSGAVLSQWAQTITDTEAVAERTEQAARKAALEQRDYLSAFIASIEAQHTEAAKVIAESYKALDYTVTKALGEDKFRNVAREIDNIAKQTEALNRQRSEEVDKKKTDWNAVSDYDRKIQENALKAREIIDTATEEILGGGAASIAEQLGDALFEAFRKGEDGARAWGETVRTIVADITKRMLISKLVEQPIGKIFDKYQKLWFGGDATFAGADAVIASIPALTAELEGAGAGMLEALRHLAPALEGIITTAEAVETAEQDRRTAETAKGLAAASQDSIDELNGRATAIQGHTYAIAEQTKELRTITSSILTQVTAIRTNTDTLHEIRKGVRGVSSTLAEIQTKGLKTI